MCVLRVVGKEFDADKYLALSGLNACKVFHVGESRTPKTNPDRNRWTTSGFNVDVSRASWASLGGQVADAIAFLKEHETVLAMLRSAPGVEEIYLDFPVDLRIDRRTNFAQFDHFPPELVRLAGNIGLGIELSIYPRDLEQLARKRAKKKRALERSSRSLRLPAGKQEHAKTVEKRPRRKR